MGPREQEATLNVLASGTVIRRLGLTNRAQGAHVQAMAPSFVSALRFAFPRLSPSIPGSRYAIKGPLRGSGTVMDFPGNRSDFRGRRLTSCQPRLVMTCFMRV